MNASIVEMGRAAVGPTLLEEVRPEVAASHRVLIVEDDISLSKFLSRELKRMRFAVDVSHDGESAYEFLRVATYDLIILDLNLPNMDGIAFLDQARALARPRFPVLVLTGRSRTEDVILALDHGADDCLIKPFSFQELTARMRSLLRRNYAGPSGGEVAQVGDLVMHREERRVMRGARRIELTPREFAILEYLMRHAGKPVSRASLMKDVWNIDFDPTTNVVDVYMKYLRDKIDCDGEVKLLRTVRGVGYELSNE